MGSPPPASCRASAAGWKGFRNRFRCTEGYFPPPLAGEGRVGAGIYESLGYLRQMADVAPIKFYGRSKRNAVVPIDTPRPEGLRVPPPRGDNYSERKGTMRGLEL